MTFQTDRRSPEIRELQAIPSVALTFHDRRRRLQLRACGRAAVHFAGPLFEAGWARCGPGGRRSYVGPHAPSSPSEGWSPNLPAALVGRMPDRTESEAGRAHFAVVAVKIETMDLLLLERAGRRRARYARRGGSGWSAEWLQP